MGGGGRGDDYFDDWNFFYTVDPNISNSQTWQRHYFGDRGDGAILKEAFPWNFSYFTKYFLKFTEYTIETTHYFLLLFVNASNGLTNKMTLLFCYFLCSYSKLKKAFYLKF